MDYEPGPIPVDEPPEIPRVVPEGFFAGLGVELRAALDSADIVLGSLAVQAAEPLPVDLDAEFEGTIAVAEQVLADQPPESDFSPIEQVQAGGDDVEHLRLEVQPNLPPVDTPITIEFEDPPDPPEFQGGGGPPTIPGETDPATGCPLGWIFDREDLMCHDPDDYSVRVPPRV